MIDTVNPFAITGRPHRVALYGNGLYVADRARWEEMWPRVYWIDVTGEDPATCSILDIETGDATPAMVPAWVRARLDGHHRRLARLYCGLATWSEVKAQVRSNLSTEERAQVRYWIADPTNRKHLVPGSAATQWGWGHDVDRSTITHRWDG